MIVNENDLDAIIEIIEHVAEGDYTVDIMAYTTGDHPEPVRRIAEAMGMMLVKVEAREYQLKENALRAVQTMAEALGARDPYTRGHVQRVAELAMDLALALGMGPEDAEEVWIAGMLHDIGKIGFSDAIFLNEDTHPTPEMLVAIRQHPVIAKSILQRLDHLGAALEYVLKHHEKLDGSGYPEGLTAEDIPLGARIVSVADIYDAVTTDRPYHKANSCEEALALLCSLCPGGLDPEVVEVFCARQRARLKKENSPT